MIQNLRGTHFAKFFLHSFFYRALLSLGATLEVDKNSFDFLGVLIDFGLSFFEGEDEKDVFVKGKFLGYDRSSLKDGPFKFFVFV